MVARATAAIPLMVTTALVVPVVQGLQGKIWVDVLGYGYAELDRLTLVKVLWQGYNFHAQLFGYERVFVVPLVQVPPLIYVFTCQTWGEMYFVCHDLPF